MWTSDNVLTFEQEVTGLNPDYSKQNGYRWRNFASDASLHCAWYVRIGLAYHNYQT